MQIRVDESVKVTSLALACAAGGLELARVGDEYVLRRAQVNAADYEALTDAEVLGRLRASFVAHTPIVREAARRLQEQLARETALNEGVAKFEAEDAAASRASIQSTLDGLAAAGVTP
jgi:hypothetical protein